MSKLYCFVIILYLKFLNAASIPIRLVIPPTSTYKPSTLLLPPGFDSQKVPLQPMMYPYAVSSLANSMGPTLKSIPSTTPGWIPVALNVRSDLPLVSNSYSTTPALISYPVAVLEDRISNDESKYSSPSYKEGPVFESIVYGTWKPDPPLQPAEMLNGTNHLHVGGLVVDGKYYNKTINRQHGGFIGHIPQKPTKADRTSFSSSTLPSNRYKPKVSTEISEEQKLQRKVKKQGRRKIHPISSTTEQNSFDRSSNREETTAAIQPKESVPHQQSVNSTDPNLMEELKQINESIDIKYNHKQSSTHSIDVTTTADTGEVGDYIDNDKFGFPSTQWASKSEEFSSPEVQTNYEENTFEIFKNNNATRRSWPTDFIEEPLTTTDTNYHLMNNSYESQFNASQETDPSEIPLALSALNIPPSLWPKLPGNITKLGKPYEAESPDEEPALCVPITVSEQNIMNSKELVYIERVFCFPMPQLSTTPENNLSTLESSTTLKTVTTKKVQNFNDFTDSNSGVSTASNIFKHHFYLVTSILVIYFRFII